MQQHCNFLKPDDASVDSLVTDYHDLFRDVGDAFRKLDHHSEALRYYKPLLQIPEACDESFYDAIIACYKGTGQPAQANQHYEQLIQIAKLSWRVKLEFAKHLMSLGDREAAMKYTNDVFSARPQYVYKAGLGDLIDRTKYRNVLPRYTGNEEEESTEALVARQRFVAPGYRRVRAKTNLHQIRPQEEQSALLPQTREVVHKKFMRLKELQPEVDAKIPHAQAEWMRTAEFMVEQFGSIDKLYPKRDKAKRFTGLERKPSKGWSPDDIPDDYSNVLFDEWVEIFCRLALLQASLGKKLMDHQRIDLENMRKTRAERVGDNDDDDGDDNDAPIDSVVAAAKTKGNRKKFKKPSSNSACWRTLLLAEGAHPIFENKQRTAKVHATWLACALIDNDEHNICVETRQLIKDHPHASDAYKIYSAANRLFSGTRSWLNGGPNQKFLLREIKKMDFALLPEDKRASYLYTDAERRTWINNGGNGNPDGLTELDPAMLALYAHMMVAGGQAQNALYYYFRALAILPEDPVLHLCIATCYVEHAFKRLSDNRTYWTQLGISFLFKYYDLRTKDGSKLHTQEAEFNIGRTWHHLGLLHLAIPRYEKVLEMHEEVEYEANALGVEGKDREAESFAAEAAYALSTILAVSGSVADARRLREKWLVL